MVYVAVATPLLLTYPVGTAIALTVKVPLDLSAIGFVYAADDVVGMVPFIV
jgi:hypothetical protein